MACGAGKVFQVVGQLRQRKPISAIGGEVISLDLRKILAPPLEEAAGLLHGIDYVSHLQGLCKEMLMNENVVVRKKNAEAWMRVVPADDVKIGKKAVTLAGDLFPGIVSVGEACLGVGVVLGLERLRDPHKRRAGFLIKAFLAQQDPPQLDRGVAQCVPLDGVGRVVIDEDRQVDRRRDLIGETCVPQIPVRSGQPYGFAVLDLLENHLVAAHRPSPHPVEQPPRSPARR